MNCSPGDWMCPACQHMNFKKRDPCQRCSCPKYATQVEVSSYTTTMQQNTEMLAGDWYCCGLNCGAHNYASRTSCYRCGGSKDYSVYASAGYDYGTVPGWKSGDWICNRYGCGVHNYASRMECFSCKTSRD